MLELQQILCGVGLPILVVGVLVCLQLRANDKRSARRHEDLRQWFAQNRPAEVLVGHGPDSTRMPAMTGTFPVVPRVPCLSLEQRDNYVRLICPDGVTRTAAEYARPLRITLEGASMRPGGTGWLVMGTTVYFRDDERAERNALEGLIVAVVGSTPHTREDVQAIAARLVRPTLVRSNAT